jgi:hypothetical protein
MLLQITKMKPEGLQGLSGHDNNRGISFVHETIVSCVLLHYRVICVVSVWMPLATAI